MADVTRYFCPLLNDECREDCNWRHNFTVFDDDGIDSFSYCAINIIANSILSRDGYRQME